MKTIKIAIISALTIGFIAWLRPNQPNSVTEQAEREFGATNSQVFASLHSDSASGSGFKKRIANNATQPSNLSPLSILFTSNRLSLEASGPGPSYWTQQSGITVVMRETMANPTAIIQFRELSMEDDTLIQLFYFVIQQ